eukprot:6664677-Pyramimonas_sp.AAC.1
MLATIELSFKHLPVSRGIWENGRRQRKWQQRRQQRRKSSKRQGHPVTPKEFLLGDVPIGVERAEGQTGP